MPQISSFQIFAILFPTITAIPYIISSKILADVAAQNSWLAALAALIPGALAVCSYLFILKNSTSPFPAMLEEHLGSLPGRLLGFVYIFVFLFSTALALRTFVDFAISHVMPGIPISVMIFVTLLPAFCAIRSGLETFARVAEIVLLMAFPLAVLILLLTLQPQANFSNLLPVYADFYDLGRGSLQVLWLLGSMVVVLTLGFYADDRSRIPASVFSVLIFSVLFISFTALISIINLGPAMSTVKSFPIFSMARAVNIGGFIRNIEIILISIFVAGIFIPITLKWFMACYTCQHVFRLKGHRFLAPPTAVIIGFLSVLISPNIHVLFVILKTAAPAFFVFFYVVIPVLLAGMLLFKPLIIKSKT